MKKILVSIVLIPLLYIINYAQDNHAVIIIDTNQNIEGTITPLYFSGFIEYIKHFMVGPYGMAAQELSDRGFDIQDKYGVGVAEPWRILYLNGGDGKCQTLPGGYNNRGLFYQRINKKTNSGEFGIYQHVFLTDSTDNHFYIYSRSDKQSALTISLFDSAFSKIYFKKDIYVQSDDWRKYSFDIPYLPDVTNAFLAITLNNDTGTVDIDEASLMPKNNVHGVRYEFYNLLKNQKPGSIRYPGGCFADLPAAHWEYGIGDIDRRVSPNLCWEWHEQRMDFGTDEYIKFCIAIGSEPQITVNLRNGTPEEAANWVEYCNGDTNSTYGALRAKNGNPEPYNVKFWEVGNEQYDNLEALLKNYINFYKAMKEKDATIKVIIDGSIWYGKDFINTIFKTVGDSVDIYGWHHVLGSDIKLKSERTYHLLFICGAIDFGYSYLIDNKNFLKEKNYYPKVQQGITEWWPIHKEGWIGDTRSWGIETAIADALWYNVMLRNPESFVIANRTTFVESGMIISRYDSVSNKRVIFGGAPYYASLLYSNHFGEKSVLVKVDCPKFNISDDELIWAPKNVPWLDAAATCKGDTLFLAVVNKNDVSSIKAYLMNVPTLYNSDYDVYELSSPNYTDINSPSQPNKIIPIFKSLKFNYEHTFPPNSITILAFKNIEQIKQDMPENPIIYKIPNTSFVRIILNDNFNQYSQIRIYNLIGTLMKSYTINKYSYDYTFDIENLPLGCYLVVLSNPNNDINTKLIIK